MRFSEEKKLEAEIKKMAKAGNKEACGVLAKQLVNLRKQKTRSYAAGAKMNSIQGKRCLFFQFCDLSFLKFILSSNENYAYEHENGPKYGKNDKNDGCYK